MLDTEKIGAFIASERKSKGYTQKQLADILGVSDKTVSKWETGRGVPDNAILIELSRALSVDVNELLSGERLTREIYHEKAEENVMKLIEQSEDEKKRGKWTAIFRECKIKCVSYR